MLPTNIDTATLPDTWRCSMNPPSHTNSCEAPEDPDPDAVGEEDEPEVQEEEKDPLPLSETLARVGPRLVRDWSVEMQNALRVIVVPHRSASGCLWYVCENDCTVETCAAKLAGISKGDVGTAAAMSSTSAEAGLAMTNEAGDLLSEEVTAAEIMACNVERPGFKGLTKRSKMAPRTPLRLPVRYTAAVARSRGFTVIVESSKNDPDSSSIAQCTQSHGVC